MPLRKPLKISIVLFLLFVAIVGVTSINHPIVVKWLLGKARLVGLPTNASVYVDGQINQNIKVYHVEKNWNGEKTNYYFLNFPNTGLETKTREALCVNVKDSYVGMPGGNGNASYDIVYGLLFQAEEATRFIPFTDELKGYNFNPQLWFSSTTIKFNIPPAAKKKYHGDSIRLEL